MSQYSERTVGPLRSAICPPMFMQFIGCKQPVQHGQKMQLTSLDNANNERNATCAFEIVSGELDNA